MARAPADLGMVVLGMVGDTQPEVGLYRNALEFRFNVQYSDVPPRVVASICRLRDWSFNGGTPRGTW